MKLNKKQRSNVSTIMGAIVAVSVALTATDWETFTLDIKHIMPLVLSAVIAIGGYITSINSKDENNESK